MKKVHISASVFLPVAVDCVYDTIRCGRHACRSIEASDAAALTITLSLLQSATC
jgi:hypothetical protein